MVVPMKSWLLQTVAKLLGFEHIGITTMTGGPIAPQERTIAVFCSINKAAHEAAIMKYAEVLKKNQ
jgi:hypothetical protein